MAWPAGADPLPLYLDAAEALAALHAAPPPGFLPPWDPATMARATAATFLDWWWPAALGATPDAEARAIASGNADRAAAASDRLMDYVERFTRDAAAAEERRAR